ncbi:MAG TPA: hypothetical protein VGK96_28320 [Candidatus Sulfotelmatobacter sp.]|jgi:hypothetical protein
MNAIEWLQKARKRIENPENWAQGRYRCGNSFCAVGALYIEEDNMGNQCAFNKVYELLQDVCLSMGGTRSISYFNDHHSHAEVIAAFDEAIRRLEK